MGDKIKEWGHEGWFVQKKGLEVFLEEQLRFEIYDM